MITLALDTATAAPSIAIAAADGRVLAHHQVTAADAGRRVAEEVHLLITGAGYRVQDVGRIVVGVGPGGFTGLRIGMATALALGQALDVDVVGVCSLETLALGMAAAADAGELLIPVIDARRREVFTAVYATGPDGLCEIAPPRAATVEAFREMCAGLDGPAAVAGDGVERIADVLATGIRILPAGPAHAIDATWALARAAAGGERPVTPMYLRLPDAEVNRRRREGG